MLRVRLITSWGGIQRNVCSFISSGLSKYSQKENFLIQNAVNFVMPSCGHYKSKGVSVTHLDPLVKS